MIGTVVVFLLRFILFIDYRKKMSDHCIPRFEVDVRPVRRKQKRRKISLYSRVNWSDMESKNRRFEESYRREISFKHHK